MKFVIYFPLFIIVELCIYYLFFQKWKQYYLFTKPKYDDPDVLGIPYYVLKGPFNRFLVAYLLIEQDQFWLVLIISLNIAIALFDKKIMPKSNYLIGKLISIAIGIFYYIFYLNTVSLIP